MLIRNWVRRSTVNLTMLASGLNGLSDVRLRLSRKTRPGSHMGSKFWCKLHSRSLTIEKAYKCMRTKCAKAPQGKTCSHLSKTKRKDPNANDTHRRVHGGRRTLLEQARSLLLDSTETDTEMDPPSCSRS